MTETPSHAQLKLLGRKILANMGYPSTRIYEEIKVACNGVHYVCDLIGSDYILQGKDTMPENMLKKSVVIECGNTDAQKFRNLINSGAVVLQLPYSEFKDTLLVSKEAESYLKMIAKGLVEHKNQFSTILYKYNGDLESCKLRIDQLFKDIDKKSKKFDNTIEYYEKHLNDLNQTIEKFLMHTKN